MHGKLIQHKRLNQIALGFEINCLSLYSVALFWIVDLSLFYAFYLFRADDFIVQVTNSRLLNLKELHRGLRFLKSLA